MYGPSRLDHDQIGGVDFGRSAQARSLKARTCIASSSFTSDILHILRLLVGCAHSRLSALQVDREFSLFSWPTCEPHRYSRSFWIAKSVAAARDVIPALE